MEERIFEVLKNVFGLDSVDCSCSQKTCSKWDSMGQIDLVIELESEFGVSLEPEEIGTMVSFDDIVRILKTKGIE